MKETLTEKSFIATALEAMTLSLCKLYTFVLLVLLQKYNSSNYASNCKNMNQAYSTYPRISFLLFIMNLLLKSQLSNLVTSITVVTSDNQLSRIQWFSPQTSLDKIYFWYLLQVPKIKNQTKENNTLLFGTKVFNLSLMRSRNLILT